MTEREHAADPSERLQLRQDLDRLMQAGDLRVARDIVIANPRLTGPEVAAFLSEAIKRARQMGQVALAESCEHWLGLLRRFREFGVESGYLEFAIDALARAGSPEDHREIMRDYPELKDAPTLAYLELRAKEAARVVDVAARDKYRLVHSLVQATQFDDPEFENAGTPEAVNVFTAGFVLQPDAIERRRLLEANPALLQLPLSVVVGSMFGPFIERARAMNDLAKLRDLLLRQALFARCQEAGIEQAFEELARSVPWKQLTGKH